MNESRTALYHAEISAPRSLRCKPGASDGRPHTNAFPSAQPQVGDRTPTFIEFQDIFLYHPSRTGGLGISKSLTEQRPRSSLHLRYLCIFSPRRQHRGFILHNLVLSSSPSFDCCRLDRDTSAFTSTWRLQNRTPTWSRQKTSHPQGFSTTHYSFRAYYICTMHLPISNSSSYNDISESVLLAQWP